MKRGRPAVSWTGTPAYGWRRGKRYGRGGVQTHGARTWSRSLSFHWPGYVRRDHITRDAICCEGQLYNETHSPAGHYHPHNMRATAWDYTSGENSDPPPQLFFLPGNWYDRMFIYVSSAHRIQISRYTTKRHRTGCTERTQRHKRTTDNGQQHKDRTPGVTHLTQLRLPQTHGAATAGSAGVCMTERGGGDLTTG